MKHFLIVYCLIPEQTILLLVPVSELSNTDIQKILESHGQIANSSTDYDGEWMSNFVETNKNRQVFDSNDPKHPVQLPPETQVIYTGFFL